jgi:hypothetical protein
MAYPAIHAIDGKDQIPTISVYAQFALGVSGKTSPLSLRERVRVRAVCKRFGIGKMMKYE